MRRPEQKAGQKRDRDVGFPYTFCALLACTFALESYAQGRSTTEKWIELGLSELRQGRTFASIRAYRQATRLDPKNARIHRLLATNYFLLNQYALFRAEIQEALAIDPGDPQTHYLAGRFTYEAEKIYPVAIEHFSKAVQLSPEDYKAYCYLGLSYRAMQNLKQAEQYLRKSAALVTAAGVTYDVPFRSLVELYLGMDQAALALEYCQKAIAINPQSAENYYWKGKAETKLEKWNQALGSLKRAVELDPTSARPHYLLGTVHTRLGQGALSKREFGLFKELLAEYGGEGN
jgi:tetratricopeptide (TPR) repeat protein